MFLFIYHLVTLDCATAGCSRVDRVDPADNPGSNPVLGNFFIKAIFKYEPSSASFSIFPTDCRTYCEKIQLASCRIQTHPFLIISPTISTIIIVGCVEKTRMKEKEARDCPFTMFNTLKMCVSSVTRWFNTLSGFPVWLHVLIKRSLFFPKVTWKVPTYFYWKWAFLKIAPKVTNYLSCFCKGISCQDLSKDAQSGHTACSVRWDELTSNDGCIEEEEEALSKNPKLFRDEETSFKSFSTFRFVVVDVGFIVVDDVVSSSVMLHRRRWCRLRRRRWRRVG